MSAPIAAAIGSSIRYTALAPAFDAASRIARRSTEVEPLGTQITISGKRQARILPPCTLWMKCLIICSATSMSAMTPSRSGRIASIWSGVLPIISLASSPTAFTFFTPLMVSMATTDGSLSTIPRPRTYTSVLAVPRSIAMSCDIHLNQRFQNIKPRPLASACPASRKQSRRLNYDSTQPVECALNFREKSVLRRHLPNGLGTVNMSIRRLPPELINRIAAGEVVERPASALKELVENSLDAGATQVAVRISAGGLELIEVADDGCGMNPDEMRLALERHATSKLPEDAIDRITSFGFRGEALPSIASVSRLTLESRVRGADGWRIEIDHGEPLGDGPAALPPGTKIRVGGLFDKVPARRKFLRSPRAEYAACLDAVKRLAMARSDVGFTLEHGGRRVLTLLPAEAPVRVAELLTHELDRHGIGIDFDRNGLRLTGVISLPTFNRGMPDQQFLFVNSRPVKDRLLVGALRAAYRDLIARDRHPIAALFLDVPLDEVDVNVHPAKTEVRFRDAAAVRGLIVGGLRHALDEESGRSAAREQAAAPVMWTTSESIDSNFIRHPRE